MSKFSWIKTLLALTIFIILTIFILFKTIWKSQEYFPANSTEQKPETVIVLHGITKTNRIMYLLSKRIANAGFEVYNITYPYKSHTIQEIADFLNDKLIELGVDKKDRINIVGHSMGGLVARAYINRYKPQNLHRVVMIATPNHGSELADAMKNWWIYRLKFGNKSGQQLSTDQRELSDDLGKVNYDLGIVAGVTWVNPVFSAILPGDDDGLVSVESTKLDGMNEHIIIDFAHTLGIMYKTVSKQVISYLKYGRFVK